MIKRGLIIFFVLISAFFAFHTNAQVQSGDIVLSVNPRYPKANENVTASVSTYSTNLNTAQITWLVNGATLLDGIGKKDFSFKVGSADFQTTLEVKIQTINGSVVNKKITISPSNVDILWEAYDAYTPPFYRGKTLSVGEGKIKVVAIPSTKNIVGFDYQWKQDDKNKLSSSGYEKNSYIYQNSYLEDNNVVTVAVSDILGNGIGEGKITINPSNPKIIFYQKDPILGVKWENSVTDGFTVSSNGNTIIAAPYFFSKKDLNSANYEFNWFLNGQQTLIPNQKNVLSIKPDGNTSGTTILKIIINNTETLFQSVTKSINVNF